jgi:hypothetical protein
LGRGSFLVLKIKKNNQKLRGLQKTGLLGVVVGFAAGPFGWRRLAEEGPTLFF